VLKPGRSWGKARAKSTNCLRPNLEVRDPNQPSEIWYCTFASCRTLLLHFHFSFRLLCGLSMFLIHF
jgi:hypothetical protein